VRKDPPVDDTESPMPGTFGSLLARQVQVARLVLPLMHPPSEAAPNLLDKHSRQESRNAPILARFRRRDGHPTLIN
jgi:hypothetical protein